MRCPFFIKVEIRLFLLKAEGMRKEHHHTDDIGLFNETGGLDIVISNTVGKHGLTFPVMLFNDIILQGKVTVKLFKELCFLIVQYLEMPADIEPCINLTFGEL